MLSHQYQAWHVNITDLDKGGAWVVVTVVRAAMTGVGREHCTGPALEPLDREACSFTCHSLCSALLDIVNLREGLEQHAVRLISLLTIY